MNHNRSTRDKQPATRPSVEAELGVLPYPAGGENIISIQDQSDIRGEIVAILTDNKLPPPAQRTRIAEAVVRALLERGRFFFHAERRDFDCCMFFDSKRKRLERIRSDAFRAWISDWLSVNRADVLFRYITAEVETAALSGPHTRGIIPESFWASRRNAIYLSNGDQAIVKITAGNVRLVDNGEDNVLFGAATTLAPWDLTSPEDPFETCSLFREANCAATHGLHLLRLWIFSLATNPASKPPLCLAGEIGSGKTRLAKGIAEFYGIPFIANKVEEFGEDSFWVSVDAGGLFTLDNCDTRTKWLADAVASAATDGCSQRRKLYQNSETVTLRPRAWICLTTANPTFAADAGLADRMLVVRMQRRTDETSDGILSDEIKRNRNAGLSFVAHSLAVALADEKPTPTGLNQRHPDFAAFSVRVGRALGQETESVGAIRNAEIDKSLFCVENDDIGSALLGFLREETPFVGTAAELGKKLIPTNPDLAGELSAKRLGKRLSALWPHLEKSLATASKEKNRKRFIIYTLQARSADFAEFETPF